MKQDSAFLRYAFMRLTRELDSRFESLLLTGRVSKWYSGIGNEATTVAAGLALRPGDVLCTLHRDLGAILSLYLDPSRTFPDFDFGESDERRPDPVHLLERLAAQLLGRGSGFSRGIERSFHYAYMAPQSGIRHVGMISHIGTMIPVAAGCAFALKNEDRSGVALNFIGDGGTSTGDFHEGLNMAAVWKLPLVLIIENNRYAFSTPARMQYAVSRLSDRARGYGIAGITVDGNDPDLMAKSVEEAVVRARTGGGPTLIEAMVGRMRGHSEGDDSLKVVPEQELTTYRAADPVPAYEALLEEKGLLDSDTRQRLENRIDFLVERAIGAALEAEPPAAETAWRPVFASVEAPVQEPAGGSRAKDAEPVTYVDAIRQALEEEMERNERLVLMGQDIGAFEGAFRATRGLHRRWPQRVLDTPIAESGTVGIAVGAGLLGHAVVVEMQFADFVTCCFNQVVNMAAKLFYRWELPCPIVIRLPSGGGVGAGPFHSQNPEGWFTHVAGLKVVCPATAADAKGLLKSAIRDPNPVIFCEHKFLYRRIKEILPEGELLSPIGRARLARRGRDVTLIGYGATTWTCLEAAEELAAEGIDAEVVDLRTLVPFDEETVSGSIRRTSRAVVVYEAQLTGGFGAEVAARLVEKSFPWLDAPILRVAHADRPVPYARALEADLLPTKEKVLAAVRKTAAF
jgi:2-oxoisovalerate dehydrogenase E1 component